VTTARPKMTTSGMLNNANKHRIYILFGVVFVFMALFAPKFFNPFNLTSITKTMAMNGCVAIGFTILMISGQLDLSIGSVITLSGIIGLGLKESVGYQWSVPIAIAVGAFIGLVNGLLVTKAKINSFIVTLGTMIILSGLIYQITGGNSIALSTPDAFAVSDFLAWKMIPMITPRVIITLVLVIIAQFVLSYTAFGRNFFMVGGNKSTAWLAGINTDRTLIIAFILSSTSAAIGGVLFAMESSAATLNLGTNSLMYVISATIIGGTAMSGGKGGVFQTFIAILSLEILYDGIILFGLGNEVKIFLAGLILALVVLYEAFAVYRHEKIVGQRPELLKEVPSLLAAGKK